MTIVRPLSLPALPRARSDSLRASSLAPGTTMAIRLTVVMIQTPPPTVAAQTLGEGVLGELIGRPGIDMTLIGGLDRQVEDSTDRLTIEALTGDVAVLDWQPAETIASAMRAAGIDGQRWPHPGDPDAPLPTAAAAGRRIYALDLNRFDTAEAVCDAVKALLASRQTRTFTLEMPGGAKLRRTPATKPPVPPQPAQATKDRRPNAAPPTVSSPPPQAASPSDSAAGVDLDRLVDQLDELDP